VTREEFRKKWPLEKLRHSDVCLCQPGFEDFEVCSCKWRERMEQRNADLAEVE
jgi:hypothetical protein